MSDKSLRSRTAKSVEDDMQPNGTTTTTTPSNTNASPKTRNPPWLPTPTELLALGIYPVLLTFGTLFSVFNPQARASPYDAGSQSHVAAMAPSYFARKDNLLNVLFVKKGWGWFTIAFLVFLLTHPALSSSSSAANMGSGGAVGSQAGLQKKIKALVRWALVTGWWVLVTQWCFGPALIDRGFRYTGGKCEVAELAMAEGVADNGNALTSVACKAAGGSWRGGHDISGHVFLLMLGSFFLVQEVGWVILRSSPSIASSSAPGSSRRAVVGLEERTVVMPDGAIKGAGVEAADGGASADDVRHRQQPGAGHGLGLGGKFAAAVVVLSYWMLLMTAIYFHTWFEKVTGFLVAFVAMYAVYILPRSVPQLRSIVGLPGI